MRDNDFFSVMENKASNVIQKKSFNWNEMASPIFPDSKKNNISEHQLYLDLSD